MPTPPRRGPRKYPQTIWLDTPTFRKVLELSEKMGVAPNVVCAEIIRRYLKRNRAIKVEVREVVKEVVKFMCPFCLNENFNGASGLRKHILEVHAAEVEAHLRRREEALHGAVGQV